MTKEQLVQLDAILRAGSPDLRADLAALRSAFDDVMSRVPVPDDVEWRDVDPSTGLLATAACPEHRS